MGGTETGGDRAAEVEAVGLGVHAAAGTGFARGADTYVRGRPAYGADALDALDDLIGVGSGWVADVGAGTGALSSLLLRRGHPVLAVDPVGPMLERCPPGPRRIRAAAAGLPLRRHSLRAITAATAFHWFSTSEALDEFHRCLRPDGLLMLLWNARDEGIPWVRPGRPGHVDVVHRGAAGRRRRARPGRGGCVGGATTGHL